MGYVSPDFREHPVGRFLRPIFANHDHRKVEVYCYSNSTLVDGLTNQLRQRAHGWRDIAFLNDHAVADLIRADGVDILVDLALHTKGGRLPVFAHRPAPVQASYLAYPGNSGLAAMDYRITDVHLDPCEGSEPVANERPVRLPETYWCYQPIFDSPPPVTPLPALAAGFVTFGCLNSPCKVTPSVLGAWCRLLRAMPDSRLILSLTSNVRISFAREFFASNGVDPARLTPNNRLSLAEYFRQYQSIDIALDPFPFPGGTTTCDALWMGVPVISLAGSTPLARGGLSLLANVGLSHLVAHSVDDYVARALELGGDLWALAKLRSALRPRMELSPLMNGPRFTRQLEAAYRSMWKQGCANSRTEGWSDLIPN